MLELYGAIVESEKTRSDFLKWKLIGVAALGAAGFGLNKAGVADQTGSASHADGSMNAYFLLLLIPPVCFYVDLLCRHISLRILIIAAGLRQYGSASQQRFQNFVREEANSGGHLLRLEDLALELSTGFLSFSIAVIGYFPGILQAVTNQVPVPKFHVFAYVAGLGGIAAALGLRLFYGKCRVKLDAIPENPSVTPPHRWEICAFLSSFFGWARSLFFRLER